MQVVEATLDHARAIAPRLRAEDVRDILRAGRPLDEALAYTLERSPYRRTWLIGGEVACMFGAGPVEGAAMPWLWATELVDRHPVAFLRLYRVVAPEILALFGEVRGMVPERYAAYARWLRRFGAEVSDPLWNDQLGGRMRLVEMRA